MVVCFPTNCGEEFVLPEFDLDEATIRQFSGQSPVDLRGQELRSGHFSSKRGNVDVQVAVVEGFEDFRIDEAIEGVEVHESLRQGVAPPLDEQGETIVVAMAARVGGRSKDPQILSFAPLGAGQVMGGTESVGP